MLYKLISLDYLLYAGNIASSCECMVGMNEECATEVFFSGFEYESNILVVVIFSYLVFCPCFLWLTALPFPVFHAPCTIFEEK